MLLLSTSDVLDLWERGAHLHPLDRGLLALGAAMPDADPAAAADWPLGRRNSALLELHIAAFGPQLQGWSACGHCGEKMEFEIDARALLAQHRPAGTDSIEFRKRMFRLPTSRDLAEVGRDPIPETATQALVRRCLTTGETVDQWDEQQISELGDAMAAADPLAEIRLSLRCPKCDDESEETVDLLTFVWSEIDARARRTFWEVHTIASAYGWSERDIVSLSPARRAHYMEMVQA
ncbi:MAG TPA: hypothetical protein VGF16_16400 [Bryobacteraceae bacterium]